MDRSSCGIGEAVAWFQKLAYIRYKRRHDAATHEPQQKLHARSHDVQLALSNPSLHSLPLSTSYVYQALTLALSRVIPRILVASLLPVVLALLPGIVLFQDLGRNAVEHFLGVDAEQGPCEVQRFEDGPALVRRLGNEGSLELVQELKGEFVFGRQRLLTNDGFHGCSVTANSVLGVQLVGHVSVVSTSVLLADSGFHETRKGR